jgi:predicted DNA-binding WGR domain protein
MARYEAGKQPKKKFWEIVIGDLTCTTTWGRIGAPGQNTKTRTYDSEAETLKDYDRLVREKTAEGFKLVGAKPAPKPKRPKKPVKKRTASPSSRARS